MFLIEHNNYFIEKLSQMQAFFEKLSQNCFPAKKTSFVAGTKKREILSFSKKFPFFSNLVLAFPRKFTPSFGKSTRHQVLRVLRIRESFPCGRSRNTPFS